MAKTKFKGVTNSKRIITAGTVPESLAESFNLHKARSFTRNASTTAGLSSSEGPRVIQQDDVKTAGKA